MKQLLMDVSSSSGKMVRGSDRKILKLEPRHVIIKLPPSLAHCPFFSGSPAE